MANCLKFESAIRCYSEDTCHGFCQKNLGRILTDTRIHRPSDCANFAICHSSVMALVPPIDLAEKDKLSVLQRLDHFRAWRSLDEKRYCLVCSKIITGQQIQVIGGTRGTGPLRVICPTPDCHSIPMDWVLPPDEVLAKISPGSPVSFSELPAAKGRGNIRQNSISSWVGKFVGILRRPS